MSNITEKRVSLPTFIGVSGGEYLFLEGLFEHSPDFRGATGHALRIVTKGQYTERTSDEGYREHLEEIWRDAVANGGNEQSLDEFVKQVKNSDGDDAIFDSSYSEDYDTCVDHYNAALRAKAAEDQGVSVEDAEVEEDDLAERCECGGCGRMFCKDGVNGTKFEDFDYLNPEAADAIKLISEYEK